MAKKSGIARGTIQDAGPNGEEILIPPGSRVEFEAAEFDRLVKHGAIIDPSEGAEPPPGVSAGAEPAEPAA